jgi:hypothetical protein
MDTSKVLQKILQEICLKKSLQKKVTALPQRPRSLATDALKSEEVTHLAKHIIKITLWPDISYKKGWLKEIKASLGNLAFKLCKSSVRKDDKRIIQELWYAPKDIMGKLNEVLDDAYWNVIDDMKPLLDEISFDPFGTGTPLDFSEVGYSLKQEITESGITLTLWLKKERIV